MELCEFGHDRLGYEQDMSQVADASAEHLQRRYVSEDRETYRR